MPQWMQDLTAGWPMIRANIPTFIIIAVLIFGAIWWLMDWRYGGIITSRDGIIANKDSEITLMRGQRDDYKEKLSGATPEQAKARIDALESRLARLEPRRLTETQRADLTARLPIPTGATYLVAVSRDMACADCSGLAADISRAFSGAGGWQISNPMMMGINNTPPHGIAVRCADINNPSPEARIVIEAMRAARIQFDLQPGAYVRPFSGVGPPEPAVEVLLTTRAID
jgi:hypothetical protein